jgi:hypothetical protein
MSGFTINAYRLTYNFQGSGIYSDTNTFSLNSNTVILFAFVLGAAFVISAIYFWLARIFTKVFYLFISMTDGSNLSGLQG